MMMLLPAIILGLAASLTVYLVLLSLTKIRYFRKALDFYRSYATIQSETKDKRALRKYRKRKPELKMVRTRIVIFVVLSMTIFVSAYAAVTVLLDLIYPGVTMVKIPFMIPFVTIREDNEYYTHILLVALFAFLQPSYLFARVTKVVKRSS